MGLLSQVFQEQAAHGAFETDMKFGNITFSHGDNRDALKPHVFEEGGNMFLIAADSVETFGHHNVELVMSRVFQQSLVAGAQMRRPAQTPVRIGLCLFPLVAID